MTPEERRAHTLGTVSMALTAEYNRGRQETVERLREAYRKTDSYRLDEHGTDLERLLDEVLHDPAA